MDGQGAEAGWLGEVRARLARPRPEAVPRVEWPGDEPLRPASVLIPLYVREKALHLLLTRRTETVEHHKGQISFPGGVAEGGDADAWATALRETEEEIGVPRGAVRRLGDLPRVLTLTGFEVSPFVGAIPWPLDLSPEKGEVAEILEIPLAWLLDPRSVSERVLSWEGREVRTPVYLWKGDVIWGATARIVSDLAGAMG